MIFCLPMLVGATSVAVSVVVVGISVSVEVHKIVPVASWTSESTVLPLKTSVDTSSTPVVTPSPVPNTVHSPVKTYPSVGILSWPRKFCAK